MQADGGAGEGYWHGGQGLPSATLHFFISGDDTRGWRGYAKANGGGIAHAVVGEKRMGGLFCWVPVGRTGRNSVRII
jgi:hypothetical protein